QIGTDRLTKLDDPAQGRHAVGIEQAAVDQAGGDAGVLAPVGEKPVGVIEIVTVLVALELQSVEPRRAKPGQQPGRLPLLVPGRSGKREFHPALLCYGSGESDLLSFGTG